MPRSRLALALSALLAVVALSAAAPGTARANGCATPWAGAGTAADPYLVATAAHLNAVRACRYHDDYHWLQTADIDLTAAYRPWAPIGQAGTAPAGPFLGVYDGGGHRITGLLVDETSAPGLAKGLFGTTRGATISRLELVGPRIVGSQPYYGALVGFAEGGALMHNEFYRCEDERQPYCARNDHRKHYADDHEKAEFVNKPTHEGRKLANP